MSRVEVHPAYRTLFRGLGLTSAEDFLGLQGEILGGHPDRHVLRLTLRASAGDSAQHAESGSNGAVATVPVRTDVALAVFLKKEHRVTWRDRLAHAWLGFGWVAKSTREGRMLRQAEQAGIGCPQALAWGEANGQAFLLVREAEGLSDLRAYLQDHPGERRALAEALGRAVARMHAAGFFHRDLSSKHVLVGAGERGYRFCFLDWQRARRVPRVSWHQRLVDLAMLDATLAGALASPRERLLCWNAYLDGAQVSGGRRAGQAGSPPQGRRPGRLLHVVCRLSAALQRKRRIRELRQPPLPTGAQNLIWLDGEALCVTRQFLDEVETPPAWLHMPTAPSGNRLEVLTMPGPDGRSRRLVRRCSRQPLCWLWSWWRRRLFPAPEFESAAALIRLERYGLEVPRLLALGHRTLRPWQKCSFLLVEPPRETVPLHYHLRQADRAERRRLLWQAGRMLGRIHEAGYAWRGHNVACLAVRPSTGALVLTGVEGFQRSAGVPERLARRDLARLLRWPDMKLSAADRLRFALGCLGQTRLASASRKMLRGLLKAWRRGARRRAWLERRVV